MLHIFRESFGRYIAIAILALIAVTFVFFGIDFTMSQTSYAAKVNGEAIPIQDFERELQTAQNTYQQSTRSELTDELRLALRQEVLNRMLLREALQQRVQESGYRVSEERLNASIAATTMFQVGGRYSEDVAQSLLASQGMTPGMYKAYEKDTMQVADWQDGLLDSSFVTPAEMRRFIELFYETRQVAWARFAADSFTDQVEISAEEVATYYAENSQGFMTEESVDIEYVRLDLATIAETIEISEELLLESYEAEADLYAQSEERLVRHILIEVADDDLTGLEAEAEAQSALERLEAGEDFAALAAEVSDDVGTRNVGGDLGWITRGVLTGPFEDALFAMNTGEIEGPIETEFGFHVIRLEEIRAGQQAPFEAVREQIRERIASDEAYRSFLDQASDLDRLAYDAGPDLAGVAEQFGLELQTIERLTRGGGTDRFFNPTPIIAAAFNDEAIATGNNSSLIDLGGDSAAVIRVTAHHLPEAEPLENVADRIREILLQDQVSALAGEAATEFFDALNSAEPLTQEAAAELATMYGATWNEAVWARRADINVPTEILQIAFASPRPDSESGIELLRTTIGAGDEAVILFSGVADGVPDDIPTSQRELDQEQLVYENANLELNDYALDARASASVRVPDQVLNPDL